MHSPENHDWESNYTGLPSDTEAADDLVLETVRGVPVGRALDVGCGAGGLVIELCRLGFEVSGIDVAEGAIAAASASLAQRGLSAHLEVADASLWRAPGQYDLITDTFALPGVWRAQQRVFEMMRHALAPGGHVVLKDFDPGMKRVTPEFAAWHMLDLDELVPAFEGFEILRAEVVETPVHCHHGSPAQPGGHWTATFFHARRPL